MDYYRENPQDFPTTGYAGSETYQFTRITAALHDALIERRVALSLDETVTVTTRRMMHALGWDYAGESWDGINYLPASKTYFDKRPPQGFVSGGSLGRVSFDKHHRLRVVFDCRRSFEVVSELYPHLMRGLTVEWAWEDADAAGFGDVEWVSDSDPGTASVPISWILGWHEDLPLALRTAVEVIYSNEAARDQSGIVTFPAETGARPLVSLEFLAQVEVGRLTTASEAVVSALESAPRLTSPMVPEERIGGYREALCSRGDLSENRISMLVDALRCAEVYVGGHPELQRSQMSELFDVGEPLFGSLMPDLPGSERPMQTGPNVSDGFTMM